MATNFLELSPSEKLATSDDIGLLTGEFHLLNLDTYDESDPDSGEAYYLDKRIEEDGHIFIVSSKLMNEQHLSLKQMPVFAINHEANNWKLGKYNGDELLTSEETFKGGSSVDSLAFDGSNWQIDGFGTPMASMSQIPTIDNTLTVSQTTTFTDWVCSPEGASIYWNSDDNRWVFSYLGDGFDSTATNRLAVEAVSADGITPILTATRTRTDIIGYRLGSQSDKLLAPAGNYALKGEVPTKVSDLNNDAGYLTSEAGFNEWKSGSSIAAGNDATANATFSVGIGNRARAAGIKSIAISAGDSSNTTNSGGESSIAIGTFAKASAAGSIAIGKRSSVDAAGTNSIQLGESTLGNLSTPNTFRYRDTVIVDQDGKIPSANLNKAFVEKAGDTMTGNLLMGGFSGISLPAEREDHRLPISDNYDENTVYIKPTRKTDGASLASLKDIADDCINYSQYRAGKLYIKDDELVLCTVGGTADDAVFESATVDYALYLKQDTISDLEEIRTGAADGATAVQPSDLSAAINAALQDLATNGITVNGVLYKLTPVSN